MTFDLKAQPASISSAICGLRRIIIVFCFFFKLIKWKNGNGNGVKHALRTFAPIVSAHPYFARESHATSCHVMHRARALSTKMSK